MARTAKNLYLDPELVARAEEYGRRHGTSVSTLVSDFLRTLPLERGSELSPVVKRLFGVAVTDPDKRLGADDYRAHLAEKYGRR
ncbi:MAG: DUF6364 family protein [bacterium]